MAIALREGSPAEALALINRLLAIEDPHSDEFEKLELGEWASIHVYLSQSEQSVISPPYMEAFLEVQKQIYQLAALGLAGEADTGKLSDLDRRELQVSVKVTGGSSDYVTSLKRPLENLGSKLIGKLTKKQVTVVILSVAVLEATGWGFREWLEYKKETQLQELKSKEHLAAH
jgi:hypothetical protein